MQFAYNPDRLEAFKAFMNPGEWPAPKVSRWIKSIGVSPIATDIQNAIVDRDLLKAAATRADVSDRDLLWTILCWGKMRRDAARRLAKDEASWAELIGKLRRNEMSRSASYSACASLRERLKPAGIGPAYFTKLIFFSNPKHDGYIMDQWTSRSVNFLVNGQPVVRMRTPSHVDPRNSHVNYETYCRVVEDLAKQTASTEPEEMEQCLFSKVGRKPDAWRSYLLANGG